MIRKIGLDPDIPEERDQALEIFIEKGLVDSDTYSSWSQICLMAKSLSTSEFASCLARDPWTTPQLLNEPTKAKLNTEETSFHLRDDVKAHLN